MTKYIDRYYLNWELYGIKFGGGGWWQPGANTVAYWKFDWDLTDEMWNYDLTAYDNNYTFDTLPDWVTQCVRKTVIWTSFASTLTDTAVFGGNFTLSFYINFTSINQVNRFMWCASNYTNIQYEKHSGTTWLQWYNNNEAWRTTWSWSPVVYTWYNIIITWDGTSYNAYVNWVQLTKTLAGIVSTGWDDFIIWNNVQYAEHNWMLWSLSNVILENKIWTAEEVSVYFNQTKSLYWIS